MKSKHFAIHELVPPLLNQIMHEDALWNLFSDDIICALDNIKEAFPEGSMTVNNYKWGGNRSWSGLRTRDSEWFSEGSQHSKGNAIDCVFSEYDVGDVREFIINNPSKFPTITRLEGDVSWLHFDCKVTRKPGIHVFYV